MALIRTTRRLAVGAALLVAFAGVAFAQAWRIDGRARLKVAGSVAAAVGFARTLEGELHDAEMQMLDERRELTTRASAWRRAGMLGLVFAVLASFAAWVTREIRLVEELDAPGGGGWVALRRARVQRHPG